MFLTQTLNNLNKVKIRGSAFKTFSVLDSSIIMIIKSSIRLVIMKRSWTMPINNIMKILVEER